MAKPKRAPSEWPADTAERIMEVLVAHSLYVAVTKEGLTVWQCRTCDRPWVAANEPFVQTQALHQAEILGAEGIV